LNGSVVEHVTDHPAPKIGRIAHVYALLEKLLWGNQLQTARLHARSFVHPDAPTLLLGDGDGRFSTALHLLYPGLDITSVEISRSMNQLAMRRRKRLGLSNESYRQVEMDLRLWEPPLHKYEMVVLHFVTDCLIPDENRALAQSMVRTLKPGGSVMLTDFVIPASGFSKWRARGSVALMFGLFRSLCSLQTRQLHNYWKFFEEAGFECIQSDYFASGCIRSSQLRLG